VVSGFSGAARVVTAAALIMFFVFGAFVPEGSAVIKVIALGLAVGVFVDAFLIRMTLVPAVMALAGRAAWYLPGWLDRLLPNVDIEGEGLRHHRDATAWALDRLGAGEAISVDGLVVSSGQGEDAVTVGPVSLQVESGAIALIDSSRPGGDPTARRLVAAVVGGRLEPRAGRAQVVGHPLPSDAARASRLVAIADLSGPARAGVSVTLGELLEERLRLTSPWYLAPISRRRARIRAGRVSGALQGFARQRVPVDASTRIESLPQLERAVALAAVALSERTPVVLLDALDPFADPLDARAFLLALDRLAPSGTTVVVGMPGLERVAEGTPRRIRVLGTSAPDLSLRTEGASQ
jgi:RND superfamily putative drug exporter